MLLELEQFVEVFSYNIVPLPCEDQIQFLQKFWTRGASNLDKNRLCQFAEGCVEAISFVNSSEQDIAAVPLQCMLIAEEYQEDALEFSDAKNNLLGTDCSPEFPINSLFDLYKAFISKKFDAAQDMSDDDLETDHVILALDELFPDTRLDEFEATKISIKDLSYSMRLEIGLVQASNSTASPRFIHQSFAEYFIAWYVHGNLPKFGENFGKFVMDTIFETSNVDINLFSSSFTNSAKTF